MNQNVLILLNSASPAYLEGVHYVLPYLEHLGIPYQVHDLRRLPLGDNLCDWALILIAHRHIDTHGHQLAIAGRQALAAALQAGVGLVSFDPALVEKLTPAQPRSGYFSPPETGRGAGGGGNEISFFHSSSPAARFILARHEPGEKLPLSSTLRLPRLNAPTETVLLRIGDRPLAAAFAYGRGRVMVWASALWADSKIIGPLAGLDDVFWRGLVWAARKPFALRGLPPLATMRVDDVAGTGERWGQSPLYWAETANRYSFKPWLGLFIYNLNEAAISQLRDLLLAGRATAFPHAFGRPLREALSPSPSLSPSSSGIASPSLSDLRREKGGEGDERGELPSYYFPSSLPLRSSTYDEFIYFDHENRRSWDDAEAARGLAAVDGWYAAHAPLPMSPYALAHWGEMGSNTIAHIHDRWGCDLIATYHGLDAPLQGARWLVGAPFRQYERPGSALFNPADRGQRSVYYADEINFNGRQFFLCFTEIRDVTGYEWAPTENVDATVNRGLRQMKRAFDSFALPVLFTHETDYIWKIPPAAWEAELAGIAAGIAAYQPSFVTLEEGIRRVRATKTSRLELVSFDPSTAQVTAFFRGQAEAPTSLYVFQEGDGEAAFIEIPPFEGELRITTR